QFIVILVLAFLQIPTSFRQRFFEYAHLETGDIVTGTFAEGGSGTLSIFLVSMITVVIALYLGKKISPVPTLTLSVLLLLPTTINETKATPIFLLIAGSGLAYAKRRQINTKQLAVVALATVLMGTLFVWMYDQLYAYQGEGYVELMTNKDEM